MRALLVVAAITAVLAAGSLGPVPSAVAQPEPVADVVVERLVTDPFPPPAPEGCIVPAADLLEPACPGPRSPGRLGADVACNLPVVYLGGTPGPCPERREPPESQVVPIGPDLLTR